jgi:hypothetical protein
MSQLAIRAALQTELAAITPALLTAYQNAHFTPPQPSIPYQRVNLLFATPDNSVYGSEYIEQGYMQITLVYPQGAGPTAAVTRAELIRTTFARGNSYTSDGVVITINRTPEITDGSPEDGRFVILVKVPFFAHII